MEERHPRRSLILDMKMAARVRWIPRQLAGISRARVSP
jgi:hypothetical protein